ncbi:MAG: hypothetical protein H6713_35995 [Myxococcales bacterium]|nr:hypothetical protein [Myxococcales bacterium]
MNATPRAAAVLLASALALSCDSSYPLEIRVVLPENSDDLDRADNAALVLLPEGVAASYEIDGTDFSVELEVEPDELNRAVELYLARGSELLAWGRSAVFVTQAPTEDLAMFIGRPGALSTYPGALDAPDPDVLAAAASGRGMVLLGSAGETYLFNIFTLTAAAAQTLELEGGLPAPDDGALVSDSVGGVVRVTWDAALTSHRFDPGSDSWSSVAITGASDIGPREGAAHLVDADREWMLIFGGGTSRDVVRLDLLTGDDDAYTAAALPDVELTDPRAFARARWVTREGGPGEGVVLAGTSASDVTALELLPSGGSAVAIGPLGPWEALDCVSLDISGAALTGALRLLCAGGVRADQPTADALLLKLPPETWSAANVELEELPGLLQDPMAEPRWFADDSAVYAQHDGRWLSLARDTLEVVVSTTPALRARGGHSVKLSTGATFLLGGVTTDGLAVDRWQVFTPSVGTAS